MKIAEETIQILSWNYMIIKVLFSCASAQSDAHFKLISDSILSSINIGSYMSANV